MKNIKKTKKSKTKRYTSNLYQISSEDKILYEDVDATISEINSEYVDIKFNKVINKISNKENYFKLGKKLTNLLLNFRYFDKLDKVIKREKIYSFINPEKYTNIYNLFKNSAQFDFDTKSAEEDRTEEDIIANVMILANKLAHIFDINRDILSSKLKTNDVDCTIKLFYEIKADCIEELMHLKKMEDQFYLYIIKIMIMIK